MNLSVKIKRLLKRKLATALLVSASVAAFATLGDGGKKGQTSLSNTSVKTTSKGLTLKSNFSYRGNHLFSSNQAKYINLNNTTVTYQKGNSTYIVPLKKQVLLDKIKFNPAPNKF